MPNVRMLRTIGLEDARVLGLDPQVAREDKIIDVSDEVAEELLRCGLGEIEHKDEPEKKQPQQHHQQHQPPRK